MKCEYCDSEATTYIESSLHCTDLCAECKRDIEAESARLDAGLKAAFARIKARHPDMRVETLPDAIRRLTIERDAALEDAKQSRGEMRDWKRGHDEMQAALTDYENVKHKLSVAETAIEAYSLALKTLNGNFDALEQERVRLNARDLEKTQALIHMREDLDAALERIKNYRKLVRAADTRINELLYEREALIAALPDLTTRRS